VKQTQRTIIGVAIMSALLAVYIGFALYRVVVLFMSASIVAALMGIGLLVLSLIAIWALVRELIFGYHANRLTRRLEAENELPEDGLSAGWNGMPSREDARSVLPRYEAAVETDENSWRAWQRLGIVRRAAGDNGQARFAIRRAISLERSAESAQH
jgi:hypothetical protein